MAVMTTRRIYVMTIRPARNRAGVQQDTAPGPRIVVRTATSGLLMQTGSVPNHRSLNHKGHNGVSAASMDQAR